MFSWNPLNPHVLLSSSTDVKTFWNKKKNFSVRNYFFKQKFYEKNWKKNLIPLPVQLSSVCGGAPYQRKIVLLCNEGGVHQFVSWGIGTVGGGKGSLLTPLLPPWPSPWIPPPPPTSPKKFKKVSEKNCLF